MVLGKELSCAVSRRTLTHYHRHHHRRVGLRWPARSLVASEHRVWVEPWVLGGVSHSLPTPSGFCGPSPTPVPQTALLRPTYLLVGSPPRPPHQVPLWKCHPRAPGGRQSNGLPDGGAQQKPTWLDGQVTLSTKYQPDWIDLVM